MQFSWDPRKAKVNLRKHGISFGEASTSFFDFFSITSADPHHSMDEARFVTIGESARGRLLIVIHAQYDDMIRIISARLATRTERDLYEEG